jgi:hypothetical protein
LLLLLLLLLLLAAAAAGCCYWLLVGVGAVPVVQSAMPGDVDRPPQLARAACCSRI